MQHANVFSLAIVVLGILVISFAAFMLKSKIDDIKNMSGNKIVLERFENESKKQEEARSAKIGQLSITDGITEKTIDEVMDATKIELEIISDGAAKSNIAQTYDGFPDSSTMLKFHNQSKTMGYMSIMDSVSEINILHMLALEPGAGIGREMIRSLFDIYGEDTLSGVCSKQNYGFFEKIGAMIELPLDENESATYCFLINRDDFFCRYNGVETRTVRQAMEQEVDEIMKENNLEDMKRDMKPMSMKEITIYKQEMLNKNVG